MKKKLLLLTLVFCLTVAIHAQEGHLIPNPVRKIPKWVRTVFTSQQLDNRYQITYQLYPPSLNGDFNGDHKKDCAILVQEKSSGKFGIAVIHGKEAQAFKNRIIVLGAGNAFSTLGDDLKWMKLWSTFSPRKPAQGSEQLKHPQLEGTAIRVQSTDGGSGLVYWDGKKYAWYSLRR